MTNEEAFEQIVLNERFNLSLKKEEDEIGEYYTTEGTCDAYFWFSKGCEVLDTKTKEIVSVQREDAARFAEQQLNWKTDASNNSPYSHYGVMELRELLDYIYGDEPSTDAEKLSIGFKGIHR